MFCDPSLFNFCQKSFLFIFLKWETSLPPIWTMSLNILFFYVTPNNVFISKHTNNATCIFLWLKYLFETADSKSGLGAVLLWLSRGKVTIQMSSSTKRRLEGYFPPEDYFTRRLFDLIQFSLIWFRVWHSSAKTSTFCLIFLLQLMCWLHWAHPPQCHPHHWYSRAKFCNLPWFISTHVAHIPTYVKATYWCCSTPQQFG